MRSSPNHHTHAVVQTFRDKQTSWLFGWGASHACASAVNTNCTQSASKNTKDDTWNTWTPPPQANIWNQQTTTLSLTPWLQKVHHTQPSAYLAIWGCLTPVQKLAPWAAVLTPRTQSCQTGLGKKVYSTLVPSCSVITSGQSKRRNLMSKSQRALLWAD